MRRLMWWLAVVTLAPILAGTIARAFRIETGPLVVVVALMPWLTFACLIPFVLALMARSLTLATIVAITTALGAWWLLPLYSADGEGGSQALTVASINMEEGGANAQQVVDMVTSHSVEVLAVQELTPDALATLRAAGLDDVLGSSFARAADGVAGIGLWSKYPLSGEELGDFTGNAIQATIELPGDDLTVFAVHPAAPGSMHHSEWRQDFQRLNFVASKALGPTMILGDLNATRDNAPFRALEGLDYKDAADQSGAGLVPTFPDSRSPFPLVAIDHALVRDTTLNASAVTTVSIDGTDHRAIVVNYVQPGAVT